MPRIAFFSHAVCKEGDFWGTGITATSALTMAGSDGREELAVGFCGGEVAVALGVVGGVGIGVGDGCGEGIN